MPVKDTKARCLKGWDFVKGRRVVFGLVILSGSLAILGGKLLGLFGGRVGEHCSGGLYTDACFSTRSMFPPSVQFRANSLIVVWRADGDGESEVSLTSQIPVTQLLQSTHTSQVTKGSNPRAISFPAAPPMDTQSIAAAGVSLLESTQLMSASSLRILMSTP